MEPRKHVNVAFPVPKNLHDAVRKMAIDKDTTLRDMLIEMMHNAVIEHSKTKGKRQ